MSLSMILILLDSIRMKKSCGSWLQTIKGWFLSFLLRNYLHFRKGRISMNFNLLLSVVQRFKKWSRMFTNRRWRENDPSPDNLSKKICFLLKGIIIIQKYQWIFFRQLKICMYTFSYRLIYFCTYNYYTRGILVYPLSLALYT